MPTNFIVAPAWSHIFCGTRATDTRWVLDKATEQIIVGQVRDRKGGRWNNLSKADIADLAQSLSHNDCIGHRKAFGLQEVSELPSWADGRPAKVAALDSHSLQPTT